MHRLFVMSELLSEDCPVLPKDAASHLRVVRPKDGEEIELFDGCGQWRVYRFGGASASGEGLASPLQAVSQIFKAARSAESLTLFACVTKGSRWDWTIEKATELGATRLVPIISARTIVRLPREERAAKRERWMRIAEDAARQSDAKWLPEICAAVDFADALALVRETTCFVGALTNPPSPSLAVAVADAVRSGRTNFATFIGPEGDFTPDELAALCAIATPTSFGPTVLRAETAAIFAVSVIKSFTTNIKE